MSPHIMKEMHASAMGATERPGAFAVIKLKVKSLSRGRISYKSQGRQFFEKLPESRTHERLFLRAPPHTMNEVNASAGGASEKNRGF